ncbi:MAG: hypothetical protein O3A20_02645 [Planctomycetota bacterium]|nr:hypothetical protein [Planctomycetota bacterium]
MRSAAPYLVPLLLSSFAFAQEPDPVGMVAQIFEETRAESEAIWRTYCAANEDLGFSGVISDLPDWDHYVERLDSAAFKRLAKGIAPGDGKRKYGSHAMNVAMGRLRCEWLPERQLVRVWGDQEGVAREPWEENYVRVVQNDAAGSVGVPLEVDKTIQQLCDRVDRFIAGGATRFHLLPPQ